jgi:dihydrolipoamide dehydrogenase
MAEGTYGVVVVGGGPGGYVCAIRAAQLGFKTLCIEEAELGGVCLNWGCIPTKALLKAAAVLNEVRHADQFGIQVSQPAWDFSRVIGRSREIAGRLNRGVQSLFKKYKVEHLPGRGQLTGAHTLAVSTPAGSKTIQAEHIVLATGAKPRSLPGINFDGKKIISSREAMVLPQVPKRMLIVGAGPIGVEFAFFYATFGCAVTLVEIHDHILPINDEELGVLLGKSLGKRGIEVCCSSKIARISVEAGGIKARLVGAQTPAGADDPAGRDVEADLCLLAVGMSGNIEKLGLEQASVKTSGGFIVTDPSCRTSVRNIFAIGDVNGAPLLAHKASFEGVGVAEQIAGEKYSPFNKDDVPGCVYSQPQLAGVGLTEEQCKERKIAYRVGRFPFMANGMALGVGDTEGLVKLLFGQKHGELLGAHILHGEAAELISELALGRRLEITGEEILATMHPHPTLSEAVHEATAQAFGEAVNI